MIKHFRNKYRLGRFIMWSGLLYFIIIAFMVLLKMLFNPQEWVLWVSAVALGLVAPNPKWVRRSQPRSPGEKLS